MAAVLDSLRRPPSSARPVVTSVASGPATAGLLERAPALATLHELLANAHGSGHVALVSGEAGIGKTSVLRALARSHATVWWGNCDALETPHPLGPLLDIARDARPRFASRLAEPRPALFDAVLEELSAALTPVLVVVEDAHWADQATLDWLTFLGRRIERAHALLAISFRDDEVTAAHPLRRLLGELPSRAVTRLRLPPLSEQAVERLARDAQRPVRGLHAATRGNPFLVTELLRDGDDGAVPHTVQDLVLGRYARLDARAQAVVRAVALVPAQAERWLLDALLAPTAEALDACLGSGLLQADDSFLRFRHELARVAVERALPAPVAQALQRQLLQTLASSGRELPLARLAHHAQRAGDEAAVRRYAPAAAEEARTRGAHREAAHHWHSALQCAPTGSDEDAALRASWLDAYADECQLLDRYEEALQARLQIDAWLERTGDLRSRAFNRSRTALLHVYRVENAAADLASRQAIAWLETLPPSPELAMAYHTEGSLRMLNREYAESVAWCGKSIELATQLDDRKRLVAANSTAAIATLFIDWHGGCARALQALEAARAASMPAVVANLLLNLGSAAGELMRLDVAEAWLREAIAFATDHELDSGRHYAMAWLALCDLRAGRWSDAAEHAAHVVERTGPSSISRVMALVALGRLRLLRGDPGVDAALDEAMALAGTSGTLQRMAPVRAARAEAAWMRGDHATAATEAGAVLALAQQRRHPWFVGELAYWGWRSGALGAVPDGCAEPLALEMAGRWREAAEAWQRLGCPYERARALTDGDVAAQQEALAVFDQLGARPAADALRRRLRAAGVRGVARGERASTRSHPAGLTTAEMQVLRLMHEGLRNAEIAARLHRSVRTVDHHVAAVLAKLGAASRHDAVRRGEREGWFGAQAQDASH